MIQIEKRPVYPIHPGTILADELQELNISAAELARQADEQAQKAEHLPNEQRQAQTCLLYTSPSPRDRTRSRMPSSA